MKNKVLVGALLAIASIALFACQADDINPPADTQNSSAKVEVNPAAMPDANTKAFVMKNGKMMTMMMDGSMKVMDLEMTLANGAKLGMDGKVTMKDGTVMMMGEGEMMGPDGQKVPNGVTGARMKDGKMMMMYRNGTMAALDHDMNLGNGGRALMSGKVTMTDGTTYMMKDGDMVTLEGVLTKAGANSDTSAGASIKVDAGTDAGAAVSSGVSTKTDTAPAAGSDASGN